MRTRRAFLNTKPQPTRHTSLLPSRAKDSAGVFGAKTDFLLCYSYHRTSCTAPSVARREISSGIQTRRLWLTHIIVSLVAILCLTVFASPSAHALINPGTTLNPGCAPTSASCQIIPPPTLSPTGTNSDITELTGLTTALSASQGGTGQSTISSGDLLYGLSGNWQKLAIGSDGQTLTLSGGLPTWSSVASSIGSLNGLSAASQTLTVGTSGTDFAISSSGSTHNFNIPTASSSARGLLSSADWSSFSNKENAISASTASTYFRGDKTFQTLDTSVVPENSNLYYTDARARGALSATGPLTYVSASGAFGITQASSSANGYISSVDWSTFNNKLTSTLPSANILVGNGSNVATSVALSGDATISNAGVLTISSAVVTLAKLATDAVNSAKIVDGSIALADLAGNSVDTAKIVDATITNADVSATAAILYTKLSLGNSIVLADLTTDSVNSSKIIDGSVVAADLAADSVTSAKILDGTLTNADVAASAAIAYSKLNLSGAILNADINTLAGIELSKLAGGANIVTSLTTPTGSNTNGGSISANVLTLSLADGTNPGLVSTGAQTLAGAKTFSNQLVANGGLSVVGSQTNISYSDFLGNSLSFYRARGTSASPTALQSGNNISTMWFGGHDGTSFSAATKIAVDATENWTTSARGTSMSFNTTANGTTTGATRLFIGNDGNIGVGTTSPGSALDVKGALRLSGATSGYVGFAPAAAAGSTTYTLPTADGSAGQSLTTSGSGTLSWSAYVNSLATPTGSNANGGSISANVLTLSLADGTNPGLVSTGAQTFAGAKTLSGLSTFSGSGIGLAVTNNATVGGTLAVTGNQTNTANLTVNGSTALTSLTTSGNTILGDAGADTLTLNSTSISTPNNLNIDSNTLYIDASNNRVGVGTASPNEALTISGITALAEQSQGLIVSSTSGFGKIFTKNATGNGIDKFVKLLIHADGANGATTFNDTSSEQMTISNVGTATITTTTPEFGTGALLLNGSSQYLTAVSSNFNFANQTEFTVDLWFNATGTSGIQPLITYGDATNNNWQLRMNGTAVQFVQDNTVRITGGTTTAGTWHHLALVRYGTSNSENHELYLDGVSVGTVTIDTDVTGGTLKIGSDNGYGSNFFGGKMDEIRVSPGIRRYTANFTPSTGPYGTGLFYQLANGSLVELAGGGAGGSGSSPDAFLNNGNSFGGLATLGTNDNFGLAFETNATERLRIDENGNVGIGTNAPSATLDVAGTAQLRANGALRFADADSSNYVSFQAPTTVASNVTYTLPDADGTSGQVLSTNGTGGLSWATASGGVLASYLRATRTATLTAPANGSALAFDSTSNSFGSDVSLNTGTGVFTLKAGKTYHLTGSLGSVNKTGSFVSAQWRDITNNTLFGNASFVQAVNSTATDNSSGESDAVITPATDITVRYEIIGGGGSGTIGSTTLGMPYAFIQVIAGNAAVTGQSVDYVNARSSANQTTNISGGDHLKYDVVTSGNITLDTTTTYASTANAASLGRFTLTAGKTYKLEAPAPFALFSASNAYMELAWFNSDSNTQIGNAIQMLPGTHPSNVNGDSMIQAVFTPTVNTRVEVRIMSVSNLTQLSNSVNNRSQATITQLGSSATTGDSIVAVGGNTLSATGGVLNIGTLNSNALAFTVNNSEALRISTGGNVAIGTTTPSATAKLLISGAIPAGTNEGLVSTGGTVTTVSSDTVIRYNGNGSFTPPAGVTNVRVVVVGGGGGGGGSHAGGGAGAGRFVENTAQSVTAGTPYAVTIGAGGTGYTDACASGTVGGASSLGSLVTAAGGGRGSCGDNTGAAAGAGGSGGGGSGGSNATVKAAGLATATGSTGGSPDADGQGNNGGGSSNTTYGSGSGGGGAAGVGGTGVASDGGAAGNGGTGVTTTITGSNLDLAGGGGGGAFDTTSPFISGGTATHGGGAGGRDGAGTNATVNTGGGGGGSGGTGSGTRNGGNGGSGVVIVRFTTQTVTQAQQALLRVTDTGTATGSTLAFFESTSGNGCVISGQTGLSCSSDATLKKNILDLGNMLEAVKGLRAVTYDWNNEADGLGNHIGFIAQEVEALFPSLVTTDPNGKKALAYDRFAPIIIKALQEQQDEFANVKNQIGKLGDPNVLSASVLSTLADAKAVAIQGDITIGGRLVVKGTLQLGEDAAGSVNIPAGQTSAKVTFKNPYDQSPIVNLSLGASTNEDWDKLAYRATNITKEGFTIELKPAQTSDTTINWQAYTRNK